MPPFVPVARRRSTNPLRRLFPTGRIRMIFSLFAPVFVLGLVLFAAGKACAAGVFAILAPARFSNPLFLALLAANSRHRARVSQRRSPRIDPRQFLAFALRWLGAGAEARHHP